MPLVGLLLKDGFRRADAEDAAEETMFQALGKWDTITNPPAWVRTVAPRIARRALRRQRDGTTRATRNPLAAAAHSDAAAIAIIEELPATLSLLRRLPPQQRMVMALHLDGFDTAGIAEIVNANSNTVRSHLRYARQRLRAEWEADNRSSQRTPNQ